MQSEDAPATRAAPFNAFATLATFIIAGGGRGADAMVRGVQANHPAA